MSQQPPVIGSTMGNGRRRSISCPSCNGLADGNKLLAPVALTCGSDGSLYVGDFNYIRRIFPSGNVTNILELRYIRGKLAYSPPRTHFAVQLSIPTMGPRQVLTIRLQNFFLVAHRHDLRLGASGSRLLCTGVCNENKPPWCPDVIEDCV